MQHEGLWLSNFTACQNHLEGLLDFSKCPGKGLRMCTSNKFLGDAAAADPRSELRKPLPRDVTKPWFLITELAW